MPCLRGARDDSCVMHACRLLQRYLPAPLPRLQVFCLSALGFTWIGVPGREPAVLLLKWACLTLPVVTMPLLGKASGRGGLARRLLSCRRAAGNTGTSSPTLHLHHVRRHLSHAPSLRRWLQTTQVGAERLLGTIIGGLLGLLADGVATNWWTLVGAPLCVSGCHCFHDGWSGSQAGCMYSLPRVCAKYFLT